MKTLRIEIIPALELLGGLMNYALRNEEEDDTIATSEEILAWRKEVEKSISPFLSSDAEQLFQSSMPYSLLAHAVLRYSLHTPEELIDWLEGGNGEKIRDLAAEIIGLEERTWEELDTANIQAVLEKGDFHFHRPAEECAALVLYALQNPGTFRQRLFLVLSDFYSHFIQNVLKEVLQKLDSKRKVHQQLLEKDRTSFLNQITLDNFNSIYDEEGDFRLILTYFANRFISLYHKNSPFVLYGFDVDQLLSNKDVVKLNDQCIKALADPKRTAILRLLKRRQWYGKELADHFGLSTATMSYHMEKLLSSRLVRFEMGGKNRVLYSLNRMGIEDMLNNLREDFL